MKKLNGLVSHETWASLIGMIYLGLIVNLLLVVSSLPLVVLLVTTDPLYSWPLLAIAVGLVALVAISEVPTARLRDVLRAGLYLSLRRWYLTAASLAALAAQVAVFATAPALGLGLTASAALFFAWTNSRFTLRPVLDLDEKAAAQA